MKMLRNVTGGGTPSHETNVEELSCKKDDTNSVILSGTKDDENSSYSRHTERKRKYPVTNSKELLCKKDNYIEINNQLDCFGSKEPHNDCKAAFTLAEGATHVAHWKDSRKIAFTLAEVLITLAIIGVVAAMTLPTLIQQHQKQVYVTQLKKGLSTLQNMVSKIVADEGASDIYSTTLFDGMCTQGKENCEDSYGDVSGLENLVPKYIKTVKICSNSECDIEYRQAYFNNKGSYIATDPPGYKISESGGALQATRGGVKGFYSNDGTIYYFGFDGRMAYNQATYEDDIFIPSSVGLVTCIDVNGEKAPNTRGRDLFCYTYCPSLGGKLMPGQQHVCAYPNSTNQFIENRLMQNGWKMDY